MITTGNNQALKNYLSGVKRQIIRTIAQISRSDMRHLASGALIGTALNILLAPYPAVVLHIVGICGWILCQLDDVDNSLARRVLYLLIGAAIIQINHI